MPIPISLLVDDAAPVNTMFWHDSACEHPLLVPNALVHDFADVCERFGVQGKFSVLPMPCGLGRLDGRLAHVPPAHQRGFGDAVRRRLAPRFDITPEILTHFLAHRLKGGYAHVHEDEWVARASVAEMTDYFTLAFRILAAVGLPANGMTSPWNTGITNEKHYAEAIGRAQWRVHRRRVTWYFLHVQGRGPVRPPWVSRRDRRTGQVVVSIPATTDDVFWPTQRPHATTRRAARAAAAAGVDALLTTDGRAGRVRELVEHGWPVMLLTHWQSLYSDGTGAGLWGLERLLARLRQVFGDKLAWTTCSRLAASTARRSS